MEIDSGFKTLMTAGIPAAISIIGFIVTIYSIRVGFKNEIRRIKGSIALEKMAMIPYDILELLEIALSTDVMNNENGQKEFLSKQKTVFNTILAYGKRESMRLAAEMQREAYTIAGNTTRQSESPHRLIALYVMTAMQVKYDVTGEIVSPEVWFMMKLTDYDKIKDELIEEVDQLVDKFNMDSKFRFGEIDLSAHFSES